jgi:hypothetical protein
MTAKQTLVRLTAQSVAFKLRIMPFRNRSLKLKTKVNIFVFIFATLLSLYVQANPLAYDVIYVRYPATDPADDFVSIPQGEHTYDIAAGADLLLLKADGSEIILLDCMTCSVMDPYISYDGNTVYFSLIMDINGDLKSRRASASWIYKIHLDDPSYSPIRLTFDDGFDSDLYVGNTTSAHNQSSTRFIRDMAPVPLSDGRLLFTSNRAATTALRTGTDALVNASVQHLYVMADHEGELNNKELASIRQLDKGSLSMVQHPMQLKDGRILFSSWQPVGHKFFYAMTNLFTIYPDGTNITQFTEPHDRNKYVEHFITQLPNEDVVAGYYYPSFDYGYGVFNKYPIGSYGPDWLAGNVVGRQRAFDRKGSVNLTPHTTPSDFPAPNRSGKYSMPSTAAEDSLLVAYSAGYVNHFSAACAKGGSVVGDGSYFCESLRSGIYQIRNASTNVIKDPAELVLIKDDPLYNEIWPRAVLSYQQIYGVPAPAIIPFNLSNTKGATALLGTSSMYNRESAGRKGDPFELNPSREINTGNWMIQGADAGVYANSEIHAVRILGTPAKPFTKPISITDSNRTLYDSLVSLFTDRRIRDVVAHYGSFHGERWEILAEFELPYKDKEDGQGNPDTSWKAEVPADTPLMIQALDANGMMLNSELTWRGLQAGEARTDCGGCHAHSISSLTYETTASGQSLPILNISGVLNTDPRISNGTWKAVQGSIPILTKNGTEFINQNVLGVEFTRDIYPILQKRCVSCHNSSGQPLSFKGDSLDVYKMLIDNESNRYKTPQMSKYIRSPQARQSLLIWIFYGERLDGRANATRSDDVDYPLAHPVLNISDEDKRQVSRWIDLGGPIDFTDQPFAYTKDAQLPIVKKVYLENRAAQYDNHFSVGVADANSGIDWSTLVVSYYAIKSPSRVVIVPINKAHKVDQFDVIHIPLSAVSLDVGTDYILKVTISDLVGNRNLLTEKLIMR